MLQSNIIKTKMIEEWNGGWSVSPKKGCHPKIIKSVNQKEALHKKREKRKQITVNDLYLIVM